MKRLVLILVALLATTSVGRASPVDFRDDAKLLYQMAACGGEPYAGPDPKLTAIVAAHCKRLGERIATFRAAYFGKHRAWFDRTVPSSVPTSVVYAFGGGDLLSALVAFPNATEITTISLEQAGDPRRLRTLDARRLDASLAALRAEIGGLLSVGSNTSENLQAQQQNDLPGQVSSFLLGLVVAGYEPQAMRYFTIEADGALHYLTAEEIAAFDAAGHKRLGKDWGSPNFSEAFVNVEIQYGKPGDPTPRIHRHIAWNLGDAYMKANPQLLRHLEAKGKVAVLVKGASYLLWRGDFSLTRNYLLGHLAWMLSDSTGIPPRFAAKAGMVQTTYGAYAGAFLPGAQDDQADLDFIALWAGQKRRSLGFRFGYVDREKQAHLVVTRPR